MPDDIKPSLRFFYSEELHVKMVKLLDDLEQSEDPIKYRGHLGDLIVELTASGINYYFIRALEQAGVGFLTMQTANLGLSGVVKFMGPVVRKIIGHMNRDQLLIISGYMRTMM